MHEQLLRQTIKTARQRQADGDCPSVVGDTTERLENAVVQLAGMLGAILAADERGQGQPYADAMDRARLVISNNRPKGP